MLSGRPKSKIVSPYENSSLFLLFRRTCTRMLSCARPGHLSRCSGGVSSSCPQTRSCRPGGRSRRRRARRISLTRPSTKWKVSRRRRNSEHITGFLWGLLRIEINSVNCILSWWAISNTRPFTGFLYYEKQKNSEKVFDNFKIIPYRYFILLSI